MKLRISEYYIGDLRYLKHEAHDWEAVSLLLRSFYPEWMQKKIFNHHYAKQKLPYVYVYSLPNPINIQITEKEVQTSDKPNNS